MTTSSFPKTRWLLAQLASHLVVALIALVVVGGATRVMEAGLACPDWPLCFGSLLPGSQMNVQVFLEWFHRLDAFVVGIVLLLQFGLSLMWRSQLPRWLTWAYAFLVVLVALQGALGALTVLELLPSNVVTAHLALALSLVALMSGLAQRLLAPNALPAPLWWRLMTVSSLLAVIGQSLIGGHMATQWAAQLCLAKGQGCQWLDLHRSSATVVAVCIFIFVVTSLAVGGWPRSQWPFLLSISLLVAIQISLGVLSLHLGLSKPFITVSHQLIAALLVALLAALSFRSPQISFSQLSNNTEESFLETCHG